MEHNDDPVLEAFVAAALRRIDANVSAALPRIAPRLRELLPRAPRSTAHVFNVRAFPIAALPYWLSPGDQREQDAAFQIDMIYSSISGYYAIRLCDDIADNDCAADVRKLAPCTLYFDNEAVRPYMKYFPRGHKFWRGLDAFVAQQAEASAADSLLEDIDDNAFAAITSRKFTGTKIPLSAVCRRYKYSQKLFDGYAAFIDELGYFAQLNNDFFDWRHDSVHGNRSYVSCEAQRRSPGSSVEAWMLKEGFEWGAEQLKSRFERVRVCAETLDNEELMRWALLRGQALEDDLAAVRSVVEVTRKFMKVTADLQI